jgi:PEP-CTERM/exosortase A-associated glycosyltransferase
VTVLHVLDHSVPVFSGYSFRSRSIVMFQHRLGLRPVVLTSPKHGPSAEEVEVHDRIRHYRTPAGTGHRLARAPFVREIFLMLRLARRIAEVARREGATVLHAHSPLLNGVPALWAGRRLKLPVIYEARAFWEDAAVDHGTYSARSSRYRVARGLETFLFRNADAAVTICEGMRQDLIGRGIPPSRLHVVGNGVDTEWFRPTEPDPALATALKLDRGPVFGFIGSFYRYEGIDLLLDVVPELASRLPGARVLLVGGGPEEERLRARACGLADHVVMPGKMPHERIRQLYAAIDVFVCPRRRSRLTELVTPLKPLEAMSMSRLVLGSDVGGLAELIQPEVTGMLFEAERPHALVAQAVRAGSDPTLRHRLGQQAREHTTAHRSWERIVAGYHDIYATATARARGV